MSSSPFLKVPKGYKGTQRQSRIPVNTQECIGNRRSQNCRSSSANRRPSTQIGQIRGSIVRSRSCANVRDTCSTPLGTSVSSLRTPTSSCYSNKYSVNNKDLLVSQLARVQEYFYNVDPALGPLKPLSMQVYIATMNILWQEIDPRLSNMDKNNVNKCISEYLKLYKYPIQVPSSALKNPFLPNSFQYIVPIWVWLLDIIEVMRNPEVILEPSTADEGALHLYNLFIKFSAAKFNNFNLCKTDEDEKLNEEFSQEIQEFLCVKNNISIKNKSEIASEKQKLLTALNASEEKLLTLKQKRDSLQERVNKVRNNLEEKRDKHEERKAISIRDSVELKNLYEERQKDLVKNRELEKQLEEAAKNSACSPAEWKALADEEKLINYDVQLRKKREIENKERCSQLDMELINVQYQVKDKIESVNNTILRESQRIPDLKELLIRDGGYLQEDMIQTVKEFKEKLSNFYNNFNVEQKRIKRLLRELEIEETQNKETLERLLKLKVQLQTTEEKTQGVLDEISKSQKEQIEKYKEKIVQIKEVNDDLMKKITNKRESMQELESKKQRYLEQKETLTKQKEDVIKQGNAFLNRILQKTAESSLKRKVILAKLHNGLNEAFENFESMLEDLADLKNYN